ncbi:hypothetical protein GSI_05609 [Ganoderma sinense ZZ0214-1]|uniref:ZZ-type domain-containing protein n=1 Tax=Ganoderma sinense ZZ0214-1 TaxID=1077348 RepID=A0A2G8SF32_9APHY|nr:hypothetical protein GSI_05609 [Ganoderma sinense ZZ0214-1]
MDASKTGTNWGAVNSSIDFPPAYDAPRGAWPLESHPGVRAGGTVICGFCGKHVRDGNRFKCLQCPSYERCGECMSAPRAWASHDAAHQFFPIRNPEDETYFSQVRSMVQRSVGTRAPRLSHKNINCDGCGKTDIEGVRHKCLVCDDYDLCEVCIASPAKRTEHNPDHAFFPLTTPYDRHEYDKARARAHPESILHDGIACDGCSSKPLAGVRHKCLECEDFDLCTSCVSTPSRLMRHDATHAFFPIDVPGDKTSFVQAQARRKTASRRPRTETVLFGGPGGYSS